MIDHLQNGHVQVALWLLIVLIALIAVAIYSPRQFLRFEKSLDRWGGLLVILSGVAVVASGSVGFALKEKDSVDAFSTALYETFQIFVFNVDPVKLDNWLLRFAKISAMVFAVSAAVKGWLFLFHDSIRRLLLLFATDHIVICGLGRIGRQLIEDLILKQDRRHIAVLEPDEDNHNLKWARDQGVLTVVGDATKPENLADVSVARASEVFLVTGGDECNIEAAVEIRTVLGEGGRCRFWWYWSGWTNQPIPAELRSFVARWWDVAFPPLKCFVHILDRDLAIILRDQTKLLEQFSEGAPDDVHAPQEPLWDIEVFNALERTARRLLEDIGTTRFKDQPMRPCQPDEVAHIVMLGFGKFGQTLALQLAELAQFENAARLRMTICDRDIAKTADAFAARHVRFGPEPGAIPNWEFDKDADDWGSRIYRPLEAAQLKNDPVELGIEYACNAQYVEYKEATDDAFLDQLRNAFQQTGVKPVILVCFEEDRNNFALAERLRTKLQTRGEAWPIFVWIPRQRELSQLLHEKRKHHGAGTSDKEKNTKVNGCEVIPFGQCYGSVSYDEVTNGWTDWLARHIELVWQNPTLNTAVKDLHAALGAPDRPQELLKLDWKMLDETSRTLWDKKVEWGRASNRSAAIHAVLKAAALGCRIEGLASENQRVPVKLDFPPDLDESLRKMEHYRWVSERLIAGWSYASQNDPTRKTRWQITSWKGLESPPPDLVTSGKNEQAKDERIVQLLLGLIESGILATTAINPPQKGQAESQLSPAQP